MLFHPGIIALVSGSALVTLMVLYASVLGIKVILHWDLQSSSAYQLSLERKTYLISTIMNYVLGFQIISSLLFIYTVDDIHKLFVGAMCATGSLNANPVGWPTLLFKIAACFAAGLWLVLNYIDQKAADYPFVRLKYTLLLVLLPVILVDAFLQLQYFLGLDPDIITSCCGSLFSGSGDSVASSLAGFQLLPVMILLYSCFTLFLFAALFSLLSQKVYFKYVFSTISAALLFIGLTAVISFISMYIYELPTHHCPFDIMQKEYSFIGYPLYISLFCSVFFGLLPGIFQQAKTFPSLKMTIIKLERKWIFFSTGCMILFIFISTWFVLTSNLTYPSY